MSPIKKRSVVQAAVTGLAAILIILFNIPSAYADPPSEAGVITNFTVSPSTFHPGDPVAITWVFNEDYQNKISNIELWLAHSTGMGHAPDTLIRTDIDPESDAALFVAPTVTQSRPGNLWIADLVTRRGNTLVELALANVTVE